MLVKLEKLAGSSKHEKKETKVATAPPPVQVPAPPPPKPPVVQVPAPPPKPSDPVSAAVDRLAPSGTKRIGPVYAVPKLLKAHGLGVDDIGIWELNEAFAVQVLYCRDKLGIPNDKLNVSGGAISIGHPYGMSGARMTGHILIEGKRRGAKYGIATMCIGQGQAIAGVLERL